MSITNWESFSTITVSSLDLMLYNHTLTDQNCFETENLLISNDGTSIDHKYMLNDIKGIQYR